VMKAVGASNRDVMSVFLAEAGSIGLLGGIGGVLVGIGLAQLIGLIAAGALATQAAQSGAGVSQAELSIIYTPPWLILFALAFSALIGIVSGIYPALRAANLSPLMAIKYE
jgi:putative ABC transport system permease protein